MQCNGSSGCSLRSDQCVVGIAQRRDIQEIAWRDSGQLTILSRARIVAPVPGNHNVVPIVSDLRLTILRWVLVNRRVQDLPGRPNTVNITVIQKEDWIVR